MIKLKDLILERKKADKKLFDKIVKALKSMPIRATIHLDMDGDLSICLGMYYYEKKNPEGKGTLEDMVYDRLTKAGIRKGYGSLTKQGVSLMADNSQIDDKSKTKAQHDIRGGIQVVDSNIKDKLISLKSKGPVKGLPEDVSKAVDTFIKQAIIVGEYELDYLPHQYVENLLKTLSKYPEYNVLTLQLINILNRD